MEEISARQKTTVIQAVKNYGRQLSNFIRGRVSSDEDAEDILQDVWFQFSNLAETEAIESVSGWLFRVARNRITDNFRKKKTARIEDYAYENEKGEINFREILLADHSSPEDQLMKEMFWEVLFDALNELPQNQKEVFLLNELEEMTLQEIADTQGENIKTIISRKGYAVKHLRKKLEEVYNEFLNK
jgi:RNA polymerase sigma factor (sigma-70 family)